MGNGRHMLMADRRAQFHMTIVDGCLGAALAGLCVEVELDDGSLVAGIPSAPVPADETTALDDVGFGAVVVIGDREVDLRAVASMTIHAPLQ